MNSFNQDNAFGEDSVGNQSPELQDERQRRVLILGSTGSIGRQTIDVIKQHPDSFKAVGLACASNVQLMNKQAKELGISDMAQGLDAALVLIEKTHPDIVVNSLVGASGLRVSYETLKCGIPLALANKESLVVGGDLIMPMVDNKPGMLMPIDSEHGAIFQCLVGEKKDEVKRLWITASGGPFRGLKRDVLVSVDVDRALAHPTWTMGKKITIDSSTLMNKGLEVIEAHHLFGMNYDDIAVVVHPQSAIHSMVEFIDGSVKAHLGTTDMRIPIQYALSYPNRMDAPVEPLDFRQLGTLDFEEPDMETFKALRLAYDAGKAGGTLPCVMNAANEVAVAAFLDGACSYLDISDCVEYVLDQSEREAVESIEQLEEIDLCARKKAKKYLRVN